MLAQRAYLAIGKADIAGIDRNREDKPVIVLAAHFDRFLQGKRSLRDLDVSLL